MTSYTREEIETIMNDDPLILGYQVIKDLQEENEELREEIKRLEEKYGSSKDLTVDEIIEMVGEGKELLVHMDSSELTTGINTWSKEELLGLREDYKKQLGNPNSILSEKDFISRTLYEDDFVPQGCNGYGSNFGGLYLDVT